VGQPILRSFMVFEEANLVPTGTAEAKILLAQPILNFIVPFIPTQVSFSVLLMVSHLEINTKYDLEIIITNGTTGESINKLNIIIEEAQHANGVTPSGILMANVKNMILSSVGVYNLEAFIDGEKMGHCFFEVYKQEEVVNNVDS